MKQLSEYKSWLKNIIDNNQEDEYLEFVWEIMESPFVEYHYELMKDPEMDDDFRRNLRFRFNEHGEEGAAFLLSKLEKNEDPEFHAAILFILGKTKGKQKEKTMEYARKFVKSQDPLLRENAFIVLGWIGQMKDLIILKKGLFEDEQPKCRAWSASSYMQMWFRNENSHLRVKAFEAYKTALPNEKDYIVLSVILSSIRVMGKTKLGISQTALDAMDREKIDTVIPKALKFLEKALNNN
ncbi:HEAT repeat domain-containing protein [Chryseobacterium sp. OV279]|uniref:HEAT repeat domain-containing protein n=1 Tax=Chryseobacterium sp. OV279 TaxID=1500285 RepID=UPI00091DB416|nr:HEAT repeat domain-containing protein [Chryseobacterium sp. OV279]SHF83684.1 HEAT repeat-containing protein [Chryseobacterium sp. OV279]